MIIKLVTFFLRAGNTCSFKHYVVSHTKKKKKQQQQQQEKK